MSPTKISHTEANRQVFSRLGPSQIVYIKYGPEFSGIAQVNQIFRKPGKGGETSISIRFIDSNKLLKLSWRDANLMAIKPLELEEIRAYFLQGK